MSQGTMVNISNFLDCGSRSTMTEYHSGKTKKILVKGFDGWYVVFGLGFRSSAYAGIATTGDA